MRQRVPRQLTGSSIGSSNGFHLGRTGRARKLLGRSRQQHRPHGCEPHEVALRKLAVRFFLDPEALPLQPHAGALMHPPALQEDTKDK